MLLSFGLSFADAMRQRRIGWALVGIYLMEARGETRQG